MTILIKNNNTFPSANIESLKTEILSIENEIKTKFVTIISEREEIIKQSESNKMFLKMIRTYNSEMDKPVNM